MPAPRSLRTRHLLLAGALATCTGLAAPATGPAASEAEGLRIATEARERGSGFDDFTASLTMILRNSQGQETQREVRLKVLEVDDDGDKSIFVFDQPRDVKGTALLVHAHRTESDDQWLYLPALKRVKRISSSNRSGSFMGSEFAYEDMTTEDVEKYTHFYLRDEPCGELTCSVTERVPVERGSGYSRQLVWHDRDELRIQRVEYYDRKDYHLKTLTLSDYRQHLDRYWYANEMDMVNHLTGKSTVLLWRDLEFRTGLGDSDFTQTGLRRQR